VRAFIRTGDTASLADRVTADRELAAALSQLHERDRAPVELALIDQLVNDVNAALDRTVASKNPLAIWEREAAPAQRLLRQVILGRMATEQARFDDTRRDELAAGRRTTEMLIALGRRALVIALLVCLTCGAVAHCTCSACWFRNSRRPVRASNSAANPSPSSDNTTSTPL
jgi:hypothetical protein